MLAILSLVPLPFLNTVWRSGISWFLKCWSLAWRILSITEPAWEMSASVQWFEHSLVLPLLGIGIRIGLFQSCCHCLVFQICWHIECNTLIASSFRILNSCVGIPPPPPASLASVLPKAHLTSHSRMSGSEGETTPLQLSGPLRSFLYSLSVYSFYLFLISFASIRSLPFLFLIVSIFGWNIPLIFPIFLKRSLFLPFLLLSSISRHCSLKKAFLSLLANLWNSALGWMYLSLSPLLYTSLLALAICKASSHNHLAFVGGL